MRVAVITALHQRYKLTELFLRYYADMRAYIEGVELGLFCTITENEPIMRDLVDQFPEWVVAESVNWPLTTKFTASMENVRAWKPDWLLISGSDDFFNEEYIKGAVERADGHEFIVPSQIYYFNALTGKMIMQYTNEVGAGRLISRSRLRKLDYRPWNTQQRGLDHANNVRMDSVPRCNIRDYHEWGGGFVDVKVSLNRTPFAKIIRSTYSQVNAEHYLETYFPEIGGELLDYQKDVVWPEGMKA